jgi:hypothetical protein
MIMLIVSILQSKDEDWWIRFFLKKDSTICFLQEMHLTDKDKHRLPVKGWKKDIPSK